MPMMSELAPRRKCGRHHHEDRRLEIAQHFERYAIVTQTDLPMH